MTDPQPPLERHPILGCFCTEGRYVNIHTGAREWAPPVHDCDYIAERNGRPRPKRKPREES